LEKYDDAVSGRANQSIGQIERPPADKILLIGMGISAAGFRPHFINPAMVIISQKPAGHGIKGPLAVYIFHDISPGEFSWGKPQESGNTIDITLRNERRRGLAAIGTSQTIHLLKHLIMGLIQFL